jgi:hypothetical protein
MNFNSAPKPKSEDTTPWAKDLADLGLVLTKILDRNENFEFDNTILTPLDLFKYIHRKDFFPRITGG